MLKVVSGIQYIELIMHALAQFATISVIYNQRLAETSERWHE